MDIYPSLGFRGYDKSVRQLAETGDISDKGIGSNQRSIIEWVK